MSANLTTTGAATAFRFSTDLLPERDRIAIWREEFGRRIVRCDFEPLDYPFHGHVNVRMATGLGLTSIDHSPMRVARTQAMLADGDDALIFQTSTGGFALSHLGRDIEVHPGDGILGSNADTTMIRSASSASTCILMTLSRQRLRPLFDDFDAALARPMPAATPGLQLLKRYIGLFDETMALTPELERAAVTHIYDLVAATFGANRNAMQAARGRGIRAARLRDAKSHVDENIDDFTLSAASVAKHLGVTSRYVHMLFETEDVSFTEFVTARRLACAHRMLTDPRFDRLTISAIAFGAGFGDLSHFNRSFRRRFSRTPSDVRAETRRARDADGSALVAR